ncbi:hypothetical protein DRO59_04145 [Candidatus Bathyarchaeota archaeon]|nr:MAG: hypothetical protein DRO59_04145 [Candidatus Bathyarchaeota archaeon]
MPRRRRWIIRTRRGKRGRPPKPVIINFAPPIRGFTPLPPTNLPPIVLEAAEIEALRLVDLEKCSFVEAGRRMSISRNTVWRLVENARRKIITAILEGRPIVYG